MSVDERAYRILMRAYPPRIRAEYGHEMMLLFNDQRRDGRTAHAAWWISLCADIARSAPRLWREQLTNSSHTGGAPVKPIALIAILVGAYEAVNTVAEVGAGGLAGRSSLGMFALGMTAVVAVAVAAAGLMLLRRGRQAAPVARLAAIGSVVVFVLARFVAPELSILAMLLGIGFPLVLLVFLYIDRDRGMTRSVAG